MSPPNVNPASDPGPPEFHSPSRPGDLTPALKVLLSGGTLTAEQSATAFQAMMSGQSHHGEIGAFLGLLATRAPTSAELLGAARVMREHVDRVRSACDPAQIVDTAGTGGAPKAFNVSTAAAIIAAAAGAKVAKHGNRSRTGRGSAEVLAKLGVNVDADRATQARCLEQANLCFCFAIHHHPATRHVMPVRMALGFPTIFNLLGPLTNPAGARRQLMGVYDRRFVRPIAEALRELGTIRAMVVHSDDGLDELSIAAPTRVMHVDQRRVYEESLHPRDLGLKPAPLETVRARDLDHAAQMIRDILEGKDQGPARDMALLNAAATIVVSGMANSLQEAVPLAERAIHTRRALEVLSELSRISSAAA